MDGAVALHDAGLLGQRGFGVDGGHTEEGNDPHPENGAGAAGEDGTRGTDDVAGTHLCGDGGGEGLEGTHAAVLFGAAEGQVAKHALHTLAEAADLHKVGLNGEPQTDGHQQENEDVAGEVFVELGDDGEQNGFQR